MIYVRPPETPTRPARAYTAKAEHPGRIPACRPWPGTRGQPEVPYWIGTLMV
jgi:hypothetical protein